jgi:hypothetical protein
MKRLAPIEIVQYKEIVQSSCLVWFYSTSCASMGGQLSKMTDSTIFLYIYIKVVAALG